MRDLSGRVERLERKITDAEDGIIVVEVPYKPEIGDEAARQFALEQRGLTPADIGSRTVVFLTNYST